MLNSFHDVFTRAMLRLRRAGRLGRTPVILAPRGEFSPGALQIRRWKKTLYRFGAGVIHLYEGLWWQATCEREKDQIFKASPARQMSPERILVAQNINDTLESSAPHPFKSQGEVKIAFVSRISEMKNLHFLLDILRDIHGKVALHLFGPIAVKDVKYWTFCESLFCNLPTNISVAYHGPVDHAKVPAVLRNHHFFVLPTKGENFCHAAVESFTNGTPVLISDQTPWTNLTEAKAGFDISLDDRKGWVSALQYCVDMNQETYAAYVHSTLEFSRRFSVQDAVQEHLVLLRAAINEAARASALQ
jgi:glycosyltransferase involved in cell wall biosynthesis